MLTHRKLKHGVVSGDQKLSTLFDDDQNNSIGFMSAKGGDSIRPPIKSKIFDDVDDDDDDDETTDNSLGVVRRQLIRCEAKLASIHKGLNDIETKIAANKDELTRLSQIEPKKTKVEEVVNYPKGLVGALLAALSRFTSSEELGKVRIVTMRTVVKLCKLVINNNNAINVDDDDLTHETLVMSHDNIALLANDKAAIENCTPTQGFLYNVS